MASSARIEAAFPTPGAVNLTTVTSGGWAVEYDWVADRVTPSGIPHRLAFPSPFDRHLKGGVSDKGAFAAFRYVFGSDTYLRLNASDGSIDGVGPEIASACGLPPDWTSIDAVFSGGGVKSGFVYFFRGSDYARYDYDTEAFEFTVVDPAEVVARWPGLLPMLDVGAAVDLALSWISRVLVVLPAGAAAPATKLAFGHHFGTGGGAVDPGVVAAVVANFEAIGTRLLTLPDRLRWTPGLKVAAQTRQGALMEIGDAFSLRHGPNGRAAVMIHEAVHFTSGAGADVPEWSGATIDGRTFEEAEDPDTHVRLGTYAGLPTAAALTNPSSYAAFAQEIALGSDERFGAARPHG